MLGGSTVLCQEVETSDQVQATIWVQSFEAVACNNFHFINACRKFSWRMVGAVHLYVVKNKFLYALYVSSVIWLASGEAVVYKKLFLAHIEH